MSLVRTLLPHPLLSGLLLLTWLLLVNSFTLGQALLGAVLGLLIPHLTRGFWEERAPIRRPLLALRLLAIFLWDIVVANLVVAKLVLGPRRALQPCFVYLQLELENDFAIVLLANMITLTPGTVSVDVSPDRRTLVVHCLSEPDPEAAVALIKSRYERPLKEIFAC